MKVAERITLCFLVVFLGSWQGTLLAQQSDHEDNLWACKNGFGSCNRSDLTDLESHDIAVSLHQRNVAACRAGETSCDRNQLTALETEAVGRDRTMQSSRPYYPGISCGSNCRTSAEYFSL